VTAAYKFLSATGQGVFSGFAWPLPDDRPGAWVESEVDGCRSGIHACRHADLPYWLAPALFEIELDGEIDTLTTKIVAPRGRLIRRIDAWGETVRAAYSRMCVARAHELVAAAPELRDWAPPPTIELWEAARLGYVAARIAEELGGLEAYRQERRRQSDWLVAHLALN
jgi:hypothetical protein